MSGRLKEISFRVDSAATILEKVDGLLGAHTRSNTVLSPRVRGSWGCAGVDLGRWLLSRGHVLNSAFVDRDIEGCERLFSIGIG